MLRTFMAKLVLAFIFAGLTIILLAFGNASLGRQDQAANYARAIAMLHQLQDLTDHAIPETIYQRETGVINWEQARNNLGKSRRLLGEIWRGNLEQETSVTASGALATQFEQFNTVLRDLAYLFEQENNQTLQRFSIATLTPARAALNQVLDKNIADTLQQEQQASTDLLLAQKARQQWRSMIAAAGLLLTLVSTLLALSSLRLRLRQTHQTLAGLENAPSPLFKACILDSLQDQARHVRRIVSEQQQSIDKLAEQNLQLQQALRDAHQTLQDSETRRNLQQSSSSDGFWEWSIQSDTSLFSPRWRALLGYSEIEAPAQAQEWLTLIHPDDKPLAEACLRGFSSGNLHSYEFEARFRHKNGEWHWIQFRGISSHLADRSSAILLAAHTDLDTERKLEAKLAQAEAARETVFTDLRQTQEEMLRASKFSALGKLSSGIAREISTPISIVLTAASSLADETRQVSSALDDGHIRKTQLSRFLAFAQESSDLIIRHTEQAAELSRSFRHVAIDQTTDEKRQFFIESYFSEILLSLAPLFKHSLHRFVFSCEKNIEIDSYPGAFTQIFTHMVNNALIHAFSIEHPGLLNIRCSITADQQLELLFSDNGRGIPEELRARVFEPFYTTRKGKGCSGLGLTLTRSLVTERLSGTIHIENTPGGGTTFVIRIPLNSGISDTAGAKA